MGFAYQGVNPTASPRLTPPLGGGGLELEKSLPAKGGQMSEAHREGYLSLVTLAMLASARMRCSSGDNLASSAAASTDCWRFAS